jgi:V8-like Glu-specific endopeptidase
MPQVKEPHQPPYSSVSLLRVAFSNGDTGWGTGALIGGSHILTCAHNLISRKGEYEATRIDVFPGYSSEREPGPKEGVPATHGFYHRAFTEGDRSWDIGVIRLGKAVALPGYMRPYAVEEEPDKELDIAGYPHGRHFLMWTDREIWTGINVPEHIFAYVHETEAGSSGSPVFQYDTRSGVALQYGVHSGLAENLEDKVGVLITELTKAFVDYAVSRVPPDAPFLIGIGPGELEEVRLRSPS